MTGVHAFKVLRIWGRLRMAGRSNVLCLTPHAYVNAQCVEARLREQTGATGAGL